MLVALRISIIRSIITSNFKFRRPGDGWMLWVATCTWVGRKGKNGPWIPKIDKPDLELGHLLPFSFS